MPRRSIDRKEGKARAERKRNVEKRQKEIAEAYRKKDLKAVNRHQVGRIRSLDCRVIAVMAVTSNDGGKTAGVDGEKWREESEKIRAIEWLGEVMNNPNSYQAGRRKTVRIPKPGTEEKRKLRIPTRKDRAAQMVYLMATDPVVECQSDVNSFGFRKNRSAREAVHLRRLRYSGKWIPTAFWETDVAKCFDSISHDRRMEKTPNRPYKALLEQWLKAGSLNMNRAESSLVGTPQGGVVSPMLCNVALNGVEEVVRKYKSKENRILDCEVVRYADDLVVTLDKPEKAEVVKPAIEEFLARRGLVIKKTKTRLGRLEEGFDFLGWNIKLNQRNVNTKTTGYQSDKVLMMTPSKSALERVRSKLREDIRSDKSRTELVEKVNPRRKGWCQYYASSNHSKGPMATRDHYLYTLITNWETDRNPKINAGARRKKTGDGEWVWKTEKGVERFRPTRMTYNYPSFQQLNNWDKARKIFHPYLSEPDSRMKRI